MNENEEKFMHDYLSKRKKESATNFERFSRHFNPRNSEIFREDPLRDRLSY